MARGRMITNAIAIDKAVNDLSDDTCRLALTWLITFADKEGRTHGDPAVVRARIFPRRDDITLAQMEGYIQEWQAAGIIQWYEAKGDRWISFVAFDKNQPGLRKEKEPDSEIPPSPGWAPPPEPADMPEEQAADPPPDEPPSSAILTPDVRPADATHPSDGRQKRTEENETQENVREVSATRAPPDPPPPRKSRSKPKKPTPAAVGVFREHAHRYPAKSWYRDIADAVGEDESDLAFWGRVVKEWVGLGWNPTNAKGMLEFYGRKQLPGTDQRGRQSGPLNPMEEYAKLAAEEGWDDDDP